jgi:hypothetical protein
VAKTVTGEIRDCRTRAEECARKAAHAKTKELRDKFLTLEKKWLRMADRQEALRKSVR